jgi:hypothetical protein
MLPVTRNDAISVSSRMLTWATDEPKRPGIIRDRILRTPGWRQPQRGRGARRSRASDGHRQASCTTPAVKTPAASAIPGRL